MEKSEAPTGLAALLKRGPELGMAGLILVILAALVLPIPTLMLDVLLALSITLSIIVLLTTIYTSNPLDFNAFPGILLILTLFRLGLNAASTKLILGEGDAGRIIEAFGTFVVRGNIAVGLLVFAIIVLVNFLVITKGAGRVAEVQARFTLDAMPAKQMSIDSDLQNNLIDEFEARERRTKIEMEADFYGAMDGAAKFVRGDAIAGLVITFFNLLGGLYIGLVQRGMGLGESVELYSMLTIGDGLVSQIPAIIVSTAAGIIVTQAAGNDHMGEAVFGQLTKHTRALWVSAGVITIFAFIPGLPFFPFMVLGVGVAFLARAAGRRVDPEPEPSAQTSAPKAGEPAKAPERERAQDILQVDPLEVRLSGTLVELTTKRSDGSDADAGGVDSELMEKIATMRKSAAVEMGVLIPHVRVRDDWSLAANTYAINIRGVKAAEGELFARALLAIDAGDTLDRIEGFREVTDPAFGLPAVWISVDQKAEAEMAGYMVVQPTSVIATHLQETIRRNAAELLGRQEVQVLVDGLKRSHPALVQDVITSEKVSLGTLQRVLQRLLREGVPIRDLVSILEVLGDAADNQVQGLEALTEHVRRALSRVIGQLYQHEDGGVHGIMVDPSLEAALMRSLTPGQEGQGDVLSANQLRGLIDDLQELVGRHRRDGKAPPLIAPPALRSAVRRLIESMLPTQPVISVAELPTDMPVHAVATWRLNTTPAAARP